MQNFSLSDFYCLLLDVFFISSGLNTLLVRNAQLCFRLHNALQRRRILIICGENIWRTAVNCQRWALLCTSSVPKWRDFSIWYKRKMVCYYNRVIDHLIMCHSWKSQVHCGTEEVFFIFNFFKTLFYSESDNNT